MKFPALVMVSIALFAMPVTAQQIETDQRITIRSDWHDANGGPYSPKVVSCSASSGKCLRDTRLSPANRPMKQVNGGLQVNYPEFGVIYLFQEGGKGRFFDMKGEPTGAFTWSQ